MGYTQDFYGSFLVTPQLKPEHRLYLKAFSETRRMARKPGISRCTDPIRKAAGLEAGVEGGYFIGEYEENSDDRLWDTRVVLRDDPPQGQPGRWCQWTPVREGREIAWDGGEKFYEAESWLKYLIEHFLAPWGYRLNGRVWWQGATITDFGLFELQDNLLCDPYQPRSSTYDPIGATLDPGDTQNHYIVTIAMSNGVRIEVPFFVVLSILKTWYGISGTWNPAFSPTVQSTAVPGQVADHEQMFMAPYKEYQEDEQGYRKKLVPQIVNRSNELIFRLSDNPQNPEILRIPTEWFMAQVFSS